MSSLATYREPIAPYESSANSIELFPDSIQEALNRIETVSKADHVGPSEETVAWAKKVLLRVLPRYYLLGAEIDAFQHEIHVNWENDKKRVTVFLPSPDQIRIYCEDAAKEQIEHHLVPNSNDPWAINGVLKWLFQ